MALHKPENRGFESLRVYELSEKLSDAVWVIAGKWDRMAKETIGRQLIRAADSIGANIAEGTGRGSFQDNRRFVRNARGSLYETRHWLRRANARQLLSSEAVKTIKPILDELGPKLNAYLRSIGRVPKLTPYGIGITGLEEKDKRQGTNDAR
jgi:four helix bundle protein